MTNTTLDTLRKRAFRLSPPMIALLLALALFFVGGILKPDFANSTQAINIVRLAAFLGIIAAGETLVILSGGEGIDLSIGAVVTLAAILTYRLTNGQNELILPALAFVLGMGALVGFFNGLGITVLRIPPLVMTLGMTGIIGGTIRAVTQGKLEGETPSIMGDLISKPLIAGIPGVVVIWLILGVVIWLILERTTYGKQLFAIGTNRVTARLSGVQVRTVAWATYILSGTLSAFGGFVLLAFTDTVFLNLGEPYQFPAVAAVVVGGTMLAGGSGSYWGTMAGALLLTLLQSLLRALNIDDAYQLIILGTTLVFLMSLYGRDRKLRQ